MTINELAAAVGTALAPMAVALAPWLHSRLRQLEAVRTPNGQRFGELEGKVDRLLGQMEVLKLRFGLPAPPPAEQTTLIELADPEPDTNLPAEMEGLPNPRLRSPPHLQQPADRVTCPGCSAEFAPPRRTQ